MKVTLVTAIFGSLFVHLFLYIAFQYLNPFVTKIDESLVPMRLVSLANGDKLLSSSEPGPVDAFEPTVYRQRHPQSEPKATLRESTAPISEAKKAMQSPNNSVMGAASSGVAVDDAGVYDEPGEARLSYNETVIAMVHAAQFYPVVARRRGMEGEVVVRVEIAPSGKLLSRDVVVSSGYVQLDSAAIGMIDRAAPFSPPPDVVGNAMTELVVPVSFRLR